MYGVTIGQPLAVQPPAAPPSPSPASSSRARLVDRVRVVGAEDALADSKRALHQGSGGGQLALVPQHLPHAMEADRSEDTVRSEYPLVDP